MTPPGRFKEIACWIDVNLNSPDDDPTLMRSPRSPSTFIIPEGLCITTIVSGMQQITKDPDWLSTIFEMGDMFITSVVIWTLNFESPESVAAWKDTILPVCECDMRVCALRELHPPGTEHTPLTPEEIDAQVQTFVGLLFRFLKELTSTLDETRATKIIMRSDPKLKRANVFKADAKDPGKYALSRHLFVERERFLRSSLAWFHFIPHPAIIAFMHFAWADICIQPEMDVMSPVVENMPDLPRALIEAINVAFRAYVRYPSAPMHDLHELQHLVRFLDLIMDDQQTGLGFYGKEHADRIFIVACNLVAILDGKVALRPSEQPIYVPPSVRAATRTFMPDLVALALNVYPEDRPIVGLNSGVAERMYGYLHGYIKRPGAKASREIRLLCRDLWHELKVVQITPLCWNHLCTKGVCTPSLHR